MLQNFTGAAKKLLDQVRSGLEVKATSYRVSDFTDTPLC